MTKVSLQTEKKHRKRPRKTMEEVAKKVVKSQLSRRVEHKKYRMSLNDIATIAGAAYWVNLAQLITVGTGQSQRIGSKITNARLHVNIVFYPTGFDAFAVDTWQTTNFTCAVIKCNNQVGVGSTFWTTTLLSGGVFPALLDTDEMPTSRSNRHDYTWVKRKSIVSRAKSYPITLATKAGPATSINLSAKLGSLQYEDASSSWIKGDQYYLICWAHAIGAIGPDHMGRIQVAGTLTFDDA